MSVGKSKIQRLRRFLSTAAVVTVSLALIALVSASPALAWGKKELKLEAVALNFYNEVTRGGYKAVSTADLKAWQDKGESMLIIDTMPYGKSYKKAHIPGAVQFLFPIEEMTAMDEARRAEFIKLLGPDKTRRMVFYCGFTKCTRSHNGAMWAVRLGYTDVWRCPGGIVGWKEHDFPTAKVD